MAEMIGLEPIIFSLTASCITIMLHFNGCSYWNRTTPWGYEPRMQTITL